MGKKIFCSMFIGVSLLLCGASQANSTDYYAMMEAEANSVTTAASVEKHRNHDIKSGLKQLRQVSPIAYMAFKNLQQQHKSEVFKAFQEGRDVYAVRELILSRMH